MVNDFPIPGNEKERLERLRSYEILGMQESEGEFDDINKLASEILQVPICLITLMDSEWQEFISCVGTDLKGNTREQSFCKYSIIQDEILEVPDTSLDVRFMDSPLVTNDPKIRYYVGAPIIDPDGYVLGTLCGYHVKPMKLDESQLRMLSLLSATVFRLIKYRKINNDQKKYQEVFKINSDLLLIMDVKGNLLMANPAFLGITNTDKKNILSSNFLKFIHHRDVDSCKKLFDELPNKGKVLNQTFRMKVDKSPVEFIDWSLFYEPKTNTIVGSGHNNTNLMQTQKELKNNVLKVQRVSKVKSKFLADMSHEIKTPISAISGFTELLQASQLDEKQQEQLKSVGYAIGHLKKVVNNVLDLYKLEEYKVTLNYNFFNLTEAVLNLTKLFELTALNKGLKLKTELNNVPNFVYLDETRLMQIIGNLINNAIKFTEEGVIYLKIDTIYQSAADCTLSIEVSDTGIGISPNNIDLIFQRFEQINESINDLEKGTGLGLAISNQLLNLQNSKLKVNSEKNIGSTFSFDLTAIFRNKNSNLELEPNHKEELSLEGFNILVAEDNIQMQILAENILTGRGAIVDIADNGKQALKFTKERVYDLILMDMRMPELDGFEATKQIRKKGITTPIIGSSAGDFLEDRIASLNIGMTGFLPKPYSLEEMLNVISKNIVHTSENELPSSNFYKKLLGSEKPDLVLRLLEIFCNRTPVDIQELHHYIGSKDVKSIQFKSHMLVTTFSTLRLLEGVSLATNMDKYAEEIPIEEYIAQSFQLINYLNKALEEAIKTLKHEQIK